MAQEEKEYIIVNDLELDKESEKKGPEVEEVPAKEAFKPDVPLTNATNDKIAASFDTPFPSENTQSGIYGDNQPTVILDNPGFTPEIFLEEEDIDSYVESKFPFLSEKEKTELKKTFGKYASVIKDVFYKVVDRSVNAYISPREQVSYHQNLKEVLFEHTMSVEELLDGKKISDIDPKVSLDPKKSVDLVFGEENSVEMNSPTM